MASDWDILPTRFWPTLFWPKESDVPQIIASVGSRIVSQVARLIKIIEYQNPECIFPGLIQRYLQSVGISGLHPNFPTIRVGNTHPFALLLYQDNYNTGTSLDLSLFPSLTVIDSADAQSDMTVGNSLEHGMILDTDGQWPVFKRAVTNKQLLASKNNIDIIESALTQNKFVTFTRINYISAHVLDFNIWTENKDLTSELFDLVSHYFIDNKLLLKNQFGLDLLKEISGRRSGDINLDFGKILYGANLTVPMNINHSSYTFYTNGVLLNNVNIEMTPVTIGGH
jgi:hypothetical protein